jgi:hypothetical protein
MSFRTGCRVPFWLKSLLLPAALAIGPVGQAGADDPGTLCAFGEVSRPSASVSQRQGAAAAIEASCAQGDTIFVDTALAALLCDLSKPSMTFNSFAICVVTVHGPARPTGAELPVTLQ